MPQKYRRHFLRAKEARSLLSEASEKLKIDLRQIIDAELNVELVDTDFAKILIINGKPLLAKAEENIFPTLVFHRLLALMPKVVVDMGAVPYVCNGANVMAPGILRFEGELGKDDFVSVVDEKHGKPIAVGIVVYDMSTAVKVTSGVVVKNIHFVGDKIWSFIKEVAS